MAMDIWWIVPITVGLSFMVGVIVVLAVNLRALQVLVVMLEGEVYQLKQYNEALRAVVRNERLTPFIETKVSRP